MAATEVRTWALEDVSNPLRLHPPSPTHTRTSEGRIDSIINSYAMDRPSSDQWDSDSSVSSFIDDRCPTEWEHPLSATSAQPHHSSPWPEAIYGARPIDPHNLTDESRILPAGVAERFATRELNALRTPALTALPQSPESPADDAPRPVKPKALDATLLRKLFRATIDEKRRVDEARRQTAQDINAKVASKAGAEARNRRAVEQVAPILPEEHEVLRGIKQSLDDHNQNAGSEQAPPVSETRSEDAKQRVQQDPTRAVASSDPPPLKLSGRKLSFDRPRLLRGGSKNEHEAETDGFLKAPAFGSGASKARALSSTKEEGQVRDRTRGSVDLIASRPNKPVARDARTKNRESGLEALQDFLRYTGPTDHKSTLASKKKASKLIKHQKKEKPIVAHHELRRKRSVAAAAEILLTPTDEPVPQLPSISQSTSPRSSGKVDRSERQHDRESRSSKRFADRARLQAEVESARSNNSSQVSAAPIERPSVQYTRSVSVDIVRTVAKTPSGRSTSRPPSSHKRRPSGFYGGSPEEREQSEKEFGEIEMAWTAPAPEAATIASASKHSVEHADEAPAVVPTVNIRPASSTKDSSKGSTRQPTPKLALKIPETNSAPVEWEEVSFAQNVVYQTLTPVSASKVTIPKSAGSKSPSIRNFEPIVEEFDLEDLERQRHARKRTGSDLTEEEGSRSSAVEKPPMERKDSKSPSDVLWPEDECVWDKTPSVRNDSNWFRDWKSTTPQAFEFEVMNRGQSKVPPRRTPQAASHEIQSIVDGWIEAAQENRTLKFAAAKQVMRAPRSPCMSPASSGQAARPGTSLGFRGNEGDEGARSRRAESPMETRGRSKDSKSITASGQLRRLPSRKRKSRSMAPTRTSAAVTGGTFEEVGQGATTGTDTKANAWAAASARSTRIPIKTMSFKSVSRNRATSHASSRPQSTAASARSTMFPSPGTPSVRASQGWTYPQEQIIEQWPEAQGRTSDTNLSEQARRRPSLASTHQSRKSQGPSMHSYHSRKSSAASHHSSTTSYPRSVRAGDDGNPGSAQHSPSVKQADEPPLPPLPDSPLSRKNYRQAKPELTIFAGKGWISPHPLSRSSTEYASSPQSRIMLPSEAFPTGATMSYEEWKQMQEHGLRLRHNHSITESSRTQNGLYHDDRYRHAAWEGREFPRTSSHRSERSSRQGESKEFVNSNLAPPEAQQSQGSGVSFITGSAKSSRHQRSNSA
ncbi:hypothetical protein CB0940_09513 [Cercospora beticola]|uniref:Uncharacterized protein n=1 Tax=Cercospora beticola TaxID=122368 RepID=A0A2G5HHF1_CERBT|nr:hypothetical protein CB0940_09513 [Cercospora beticola]PIA91984.1 hypothetical protein CB0940_09513 [Cercospora beticola]WPB06165.1 hypothetical protein RHO25_010822 [Cercospora beticola]